MLVTGVGASLDARTAPPVAPGNGPVAAGEPRSVAPWDRVGRDRAADQPAPAPAVAVEAPAVGLQASLVPVGKTADGALDLPGFGTAGWYQHSVVPGAPGAAVLAGHVDSTTGPDVFHALGRLRPGDEIFVRHADGATSRFVVHGHEIVDKDALPVHRIFDEPAGPELRLITCGGAFDRDARSYADNVIVYARLAEPPAVAAA